MMKENNKRWVCGFVSVILTYVLCHILMFVIGGMFWDDHFLWNVPFADFVAEIGPENCNNVFENLFFNFIVLNFSLETQVVLFRLTVFICGLISTIAVWFILKKILKKFWTVLAASLLFAACGMNRCEMLICCTHYTFSNMFYYLGLMLMVFDYYNENPFKRIGAAILWLMALIMWRSAVLLIPATVIILSACRTDFKWNCIKSYWNVVVVAIKKYWLVIVSCVIYAALYLTVLHPQGYHSNYYAIQLKNVFLSPLTTPLTCIHILFVYLAELAKAFAFGDSLLSVFPLLLAGGIYWAIRDFEVKIDNPQKFFWISVVFFLFAVWPQMLIKQVIYTISLSGTASRIASLALLPTCILISLSISFSRPKLQRLLFSVLLSASIFYSISVYVDYSRGWAKNDAIARFYSKHPELDGKQIHFEDRSASINAFPGDPMRTYEFEGIARLVYGQNSKTKAETEFFGNLDPAFSPEVFVEIDGGKIFNDYKLFVYRFLKTDWYSDMVDNIVNIRIVE